MSATKICETCRYGVQWSTPGGREEPPDGGIDCSLEEDAPEKHKLVVWTGDEGIDIDCPAWEPHQPCEHHPDDTITPGHGCASCEHESDAAMSAAEASERIEAHLDNINLLVDALCKAGYDHRLWNIENRLAAMLKESTSPSEHRQLPEGWEPTPDTTIKLDPDFKPASE